jgi:bifunctional DNA-binding transcriptional regulator/antitoxin component of YhaV-PrlF toxin-antitoxin module
LREAYGIKEGGEIVVIPEKDGLFIRSKEDPDAIYEEILEWKRRVRGKPAKLGDLRSVELEEFQ